LKKLKAIVIADGVKAKLSHHSRAYLKGAAEFGDAELDKVVAELRAETILLECELTHLLYELQVVIEVILYIKVLPLHSDVSVLPLTSSHTSESTDSQNNRLVFDRSSITQHVKNLQLEAKLVQDDSVLYNASVAICVD